MWQNIKYYVLALVIIVVAALVSTGLQLLEGSLPVGHPVSTLAANLSGVTIGGIIMVIGFLRDSRLDEERKRTEEAHRRAEEAQTRAEEAQTRAEEEHNRAEQQRQRAEAAEARIQEERERMDGYVRELMRLHENYVSLFQRLQDQDAQNGHTPSADE